MYAFVEISGHQYRVEANQVIFTEKTGHPVGEDFESEKVMAFWTEAGLEVGTPYVPSARVKLQVLEDLNAPKVRGIKFKRRKGYMRRFGHRQQVQKLKILDITKSA